MLKFCIVIPSYNRPTYLTEALRSLQEQTYEHWQAIVVDDASTEDYATVERAFRDDARIHFAHRRVNGGANKACNTGLDIAAQRNDIDYIAIMDDEDRFEPDYLATASQVILAHPGYRWFMSNNVGEQKPSSRTVTDEGELDFIDDVIYRKFRGDKGRLIAADLLKTLRMDERFRGAHRWPFFIELAAQTKIWAFPHASIRKRYLDSGITRTFKSQTPKQLADISYPVYKHWCVIRKRPGTLRAYRYLLLEIIKTPRRFVRLCVGRLSALPGSRERDADLIIRENTERRD